MRASFKVIMLFSLLFILNSVFAQQIKISTEPTKPVVGQSFKFLVEITTDSDDEPYVNFDQGQLEILGRSSSVGTYSSFVGGGGKISITRKYVFAYDAMVSKPGEFLVRNIVVDIGSISKKIDNHKIFVLREAERAADIFLKAEPSKNKVYVGEGFDIYYYLYFKRPAEVIGYDQFPKLERFLKRIVHDPTQKANEERVNINGEVYAKVLQYSARLFPLKAGKSYIDSLSLKVLLHDTQRAMFGGFGMNFSKPMPRDVNSERVEIEVLPVPAENVPANFSGLIGDHDINLSIQKNKFLVNEPIEVKLTVEGPGALENFDAPLVYQHPSLEQFDVKSDVNIVSLDRGRKTFEYTYLPREQLNIEERVMSLSFFDPESKSFKEKKIKIDGIIASGGNYSSQSSPPAEISKQESSQGIISSMLSSNQGIIGPKFEQNSISFEWQKYLLWFFSLILIFTWFKLLKNSIFTGQKKTIQEEIVKEIKRYGIDYSRLYKLFISFEWYDKTAPIEILKQMDLTPEAKKYFNELIALAEEHNYSQNDHLKKMPFVKKYFNELIIIAKRRQ